MKIKINIGVKLLLALIVIVSIQQVNAQKPRVVRHNKIIHPKKARVVARKNATSNVQNKAIKVLKRTNHVIVDAKKAVNKYKVYSGDLSRALHHQQLAKKLMNHNKVNQSMQHSRIAREYAFKSIKLNKGTINKEYEFTQEEKNFMGKNTPSDELDADLKSQTPNAGYKDENITDKDMTELDVLNIDSSEYKTE